MPTYTYRCQQCQQEQSVVHGMLDQPMLVCAKCGNFCKKVVTAAPVVLTVESVNLAKEELASTPHHDCGAHCALHRLNPLSKPKPIAEVD